MSQPHEWNVSTGHGRASGLTLISFSKLPWPTQGTRLQTRGPHKEVGEGGSVQAEPREWTSCPGCREQNPGSSELQA